MESCEINIGPNGSIETLRPRIYCVVGANSPDDRSCSGSVSSFLVAVVASESEATRCAGLKSWIAPVGAGRLAWTFFSNFKVGEIDENDFAELVWYSWFWTHMFEKLKFTLLTSWWKWKLWSKHVANIYIVDWWKLNLWCKYLLVVNIFEHSITLRVQRIKQLEHVLDFCPGTKINIFNFFCEYVQTSNILRLRSKYFEKSIWILIWFLFSSTCGLFQLASGVPDRFLFLRWRLRVVTRHGVDGSEDLDLKRNLEIEI